MKIVQTAERKQSSKLLTTINYDIAWKDLKYQSFDVKTIKNCYDSCTRVFRRPYHRQNVKVHGVTHKEMYAAEMKPVFL